jgi:hypothetical protein
MSARLSNFDRAVEFTQTNPSKSKPHQIKPSKIAWIYLVLFVRIGTFQWVTANPNKKTLSRLRLGAKRLKRLPLSFSPPRSLARRGLSIRQWKIHTTYFLFPQIISRFFIGSSGQTARGTRFQMVMSFPLASGNDRQWPRRIAGLKAPPCLASDLNTDNARA